MHASYILQWKGTVTWDLYARSVWTCLLCWATTMFTQKTRCRYSIYLLLPFLFGICFLFLQKIVCYVYNDVHTHCSLSLSSTERLRRPGPPLLPPTGPTFSPTWMSSPPIAVISHSAAVMAATPCCPGGWWDSTRTCGTSPTASHRAWRIRLTSSGRTAQITSYSCYRYQSIAQLQVAELKAQLLVNWPNVFEQFEAKRHRACPAVQHEQQLKCSSGGVVTGVYVLLSPNSDRSNHLRFEAWKPVVVKKRDMGVDIFDL